MRDKDILARAASRSLPAPLHVRHMGVGQLQGAQQARKATRTEHLIPPSIILCTDLFTSPP